MYHNGDGIRVDWKFKYKAAALAVGAVAQKEFRLGRVKFWSDVKEEVLKKIGESGITVVQSAGAGRDNLKLSYAGTQTMGPRVQVDRVLEEQLQEAHHKVEEHRKAAAEFEGWIQCLTANPEQELDVTQEDWLYFFRKS